MQFRIIKLTNNDDPKEFTLEITRMRDIRQRIGIRALVAEKWEMPSHSETADMGTGYGR